MKNIEIVKFKDEKYGIRKYTFFGITLSYKDLADGTVNRYWWDMNSEFFYACRGTKERAEEVFDYITDEGTPVNES